MCTRYISNMKILSPPPKKGKSKKNTKKAAT